MPCRPLDEDIWHIILPLLKRPIPRWVGDSWGKKSSALQPELAVMARLNSVGDPFLSTELPYTSLRFPALMPLLINETFC
jgi:hypothetical protein